MKRWCGLIFSLVIGATLLCGYVAPKDRKYVDYFLKLHAADLFRSKSFLLESSWAYVSRKGIERIDMRFSFYRVLTVNQARELIVEEKTFFLCPFCLLSCTWRLGQTMSSRSILTLSLFSE